MTTREVEVAVAAFSAQEKLFSTGEPLLVALSGGADSVALLLLLLGMGHPVFALHVHHGIRGEEADRDAVFCTELCKSLGVPCGVAYTDVPSLAARRGVGIEEAARDERYRILALFARGRKICVAHHATDNLETVLFHLMRGTGTAGLCGIPPRRGDIVRPCLSVSGADLAAYVTARGYTFVTDSTNADTTQTRNFLRHEVVPRLLAVRARGDIAVAELSARVRAEQAYFADEAARIPDDAAPAVLAALPEPIFVRYLARRLAACGATLSTESVAAAREVVTKRRGTRRDVAGATLVHAGTYLAVMARETAATPIVAETLTFDVPWLGTDMALLVTRDETVAKAFRNIYKFSTSVAVSSATIGKALTVRGRAAGDTVFCGGMHRTVKNLMQAANVLKDRRVQIPFLCDADGILWIPGVAVRDGATGDTGDVYLIFGRKKECAI